MTNKILDHFGAHDIQTSFDGNTLWVTATDGSCVGRFSKKFGIDIHTSSSEQLNGANQCLFCTHSPAGQKDWQKFREKILTFHGISVPEDSLNWD